MKIYYVDCVNGTFLKNFRGELLSHCFPILPFRIQKIVLSPKFLSSKRIISKAKERLEIINFNSANSSGYIRNPIEVRIKSFCGLIIEQLCFVMLSYYNKNPNIKIELDNSNNSVNQIDLKIKKQWLNQESKFDSIIKTVEIRSSFPFKPIEKAVSQDFDILGAYRNNIKQGEIEKDFYLRFLFSLDYNAENYVKDNDNRINYSKTTTKTLIEDYFNDDLTLKKEMVIYFIGGATNTMMLDDSISYIGSMRSSNFNQENKGQFRKMKVRNALDCIAIMQMMLNVITTEATQGK